jgi:hypothetical protein
MKVLACALLALIAFVPGVSAQPPVLDLTAPAIFDATSQERLTDVPGAGRQATSSVRGGVASGMRTPSKTLNVTLVDIDSSCTLGDAVFYELNVSNTGSEPLTLPWSRMQSDAVGPLNRPEIGYQKMVLLLTIQDRTKPQSTMYLGSPAVAYGSVAAPGTLKVVPPGETVRVKARASCSSLSTGADFDKLRQSVPASFIVHAELQVWSAPEVPEVRVTSSFSNLDIRGK